MYHPQESLDRIADAYEADGAVLTRERAADTLRDQLLGGVGTGQGALRRLEARIAELTTTVGPSFRTGSWIPTGGGVTEDDDGLSEDLIALAVALIEWGATGSIGARGLRAQVEFKSWLTRHGWTDVDYLLDRGRRLRATRDEARRLLASEVPSDDALGRCAALVLYLRDFMGACDHDFAPVETDPGVVVMECRNRRCGARYALDGKVRLAL